MKYLILIFLLCACACTSKSWRDASRESVGIAPKPDELKEDIFQIYYARAYSWRGYFGTHPWIAWKKVEDKQYTVAHVTSWNVRRNGSAVSEIEDLPDRKWFDSIPTIMFEVRGTKAGKIIEQVQGLIKKYPFNDRYRVWPGPNSNTFVSYIIRNIDELNIELPANAVGKDYLGTSQFLTSSPSGTGFQFSAFGVLGLTMGLGEGVEVNVLGLSFGLDMWTPALKVPIFGRLGFPDKAVSN